MSAAAHFLEHSTVAAPMSSDIAENSLAHSIPSDLGAAFEFEIIDSLAAFDALKPEWDALHTRNQHNQLCFQSHTWLRSWLVTYSEALDGPLSTAGVVIVRVDGAVQLICPLAIRSSFGMVHMTWLGEPASQYGDLITNDESPTSDTLVAVAMEHALSVFKPDIVHLRKVRQDASIVPWLRVCNATSVASDQAPYLAFNGCRSFDEYCSKYSSKSRKNRRRLRRRLAENGTIDTTVLECGDQACDAIRIGMRFKQQWLVERGHLSSALRDKHITDFITDFVGQCNPLAKPFVSIMRCDGLPVSVQFGIVSKHRLALHMIAYNPLTEKSGAGVLHVEDTIRHCIETGLTELDFLAPNAPYKQAWADAAIPVSDYVIATSLRGRLYAQAYLCSARPALKTSAATLPLGLRQNIARRMQK